MTELGKIETDNEKLAEYSAKLAKAVFNIDGPSARAKSVVVNKYTALLDQLEATSQRGRDGGTISLKKRINKIRRTLAALTGDTSYTDNLFDEGPVRGRGGEKRKPREPREPKVEKPTPAPTVSQEAIAAALAQMSPEAIQAILDAKKAGGAS